MRRPRGPLVAIAWADFQPRTVAIAAERLAGEALFVSSRLRGHPALLPARYLAGAARTWRLLEDRSPERVVVITPPVVAPLVAWLWCGLRRRPLVVDCHTDTFHAGRWAWARPIHRWLLRRSRAALVHTDEARALVDGWGAPVLLLPDDLPARSDAEPRSPAGQPTVLVAGSLDGNEPVAAAVAMAGLLPDVEVRLTGHLGRVPAALREAAPPNAVFTGFLPYRAFLGEMLAAHAVAVFSTDPHIMNRAAFEAVGLGRPLVLSDLEGLRGRFGSAARFAANRPDAMAAAVEDALRDGAELAARSRDLAGALGEQRQRAMARLRHLLDDDAGAGHSRRLLRVTQHPFPGHPMVRRDVLELLERGFEVDVVCSAGPPASDDGALGRHRGLRVFRVPIGHRRRPLARYPLEYAGFFLAALALVSGLGLRRRYAAVQVDNLPDVLVFAAPVPRWRGARLVFTMYELTPEMVAARFRGRSGRALVGLARWLERAATRWADRVIVVSQPCFEVLRSRGVPASRMSVVLNTTAASSSRAAPAAARDWPPVLVTHTTLVPRYGVDVAIRAMAILRPAWPDLTLRVVGDGEQRDTLERLARALGLGGRVVFTGNLSWPEAQDEVGRATLGIVAVVSDGYGQLLLPTKLLEYARLGIPAVCSRLPAIQAYFSADAAAYFAPGDERELAAQVARLLRAPELARRQALCAAETARTLAWERVRFDYLRALGLEAPPPRGGRDVARGARSP